MRPVLWTTITASLLALSGCSCSDDAARNADKEIILYAGAGLRPAADPVIDAFEHSTGIRVAANYGGSGRQLGQITAIQKGDLFMPGAELYVDVAVEKGLAEKATKRTVAFFIPVIFVQKGNPKGIRSLYDFKRKGLRLGFGDERACAVGRKTLKILKKAGISYDELRENVVYKSGTVNELGTAIQMKNVDAVILWDANARQFAAYGDVVPIPPDLNDISTVPIVRLKSSRLSEEAARFIEFITSKEGKAILTEHGYTTSLEPVRAPQGEAGGEEGAAE
jgi:molybdate transport system substrate-binding protein